MTLSTKEIARIKRIMETHKKLIKATRHRLVTDLDTPAQRIINGACAEMGIPRIDWEKIEAVHKGTTDDYAPPSAHILRQWERY